MAKCGLPHETAKRERKKKIPSFLPFALKKARLLEKPDLSLFPPLTLFNVSPLLIHPPPSLYCTVCNKHTLQSSGVVCTYVGPFQITYRTRMYLYRHSCRVLSKFPKHRSKKCFETSLQKTSLSVPIGRTAIS